MFEAMVKGLLFDKWNKCMDVDFKNQKKTSGLHLKTNPSMNLSKRNLNMKDAKFKMC